MERPVEGISCRSHFRFEGHFQSPKCKVLNQLDVKDTLHKLHANYVLVPADKAANNVIAVCKKYYVDTLVEELGINNVNSNNPTYISIDDSFETVVKSHNQFITSVGLEMSEEDQNLTYLYWTPKLHKSPYKHKCTTKDLSWLTKLLSTIKDGMVRYCNIKTSRNGINNIWILKNSTSLLSSLDSYISPDIGLFHFLSVQGDGRKIPGLVKSMNFQRSTQNLPKFQGVGNTFQQNS